ncbi:mucin-19-like [Dermacentor albipictus]|uniref:mucin-19-like n=1 Tax=Dermacentor albipictus TaxID=60249 RepID=UPI0031FCD671
MSAGKVLALVVVVASFAIVALGVSWCCWCVRSRFGTADKSIHGLKSVATVADTMDSSARAAKSSLLSATLPTTATTATMTQPRATASESRRLNAAAEVDAPAKQSLAPFASAMLHSGFESGCTTPSTEGATARPVKPKPKPADTSLPPKVVRSDDDQLRKPFPGVSGGLQRRISKVDLFVCEKTAAPQSARRSSQTPAPSSGANDHKRAEVEDGMERTSTVKVLKLGDWDDETSLSIFESASATTPSGRDSALTKSVTRSLLGSAEPVRKFLHQKSTLQRGAGTLPAGSSTIPQTLDCRPLAVLNSRGQRLTRTPTGQTGPALGCKEIIGTKQRSEGPSSPYKDASEVTSAARGHIATAIIGKKGVERRPSFMTPMKSEKFEGCTKARGATTRPTKGTGQELVEKEAGKPFHSTWAGKRSLLRKAQRAAALCPRKGSDTPEVSIVINVPKEEMSLLDVTKEQMLGSANYCSTSAKKESQ